MAERVDRARRAAFVIAIALAAILVAGVVYLHPGEGTSRRILVAGSPSQPVQLLADRVAASYDFATPSLGWALVIDRNAGVAERFWVFVTHDGAQHWSQQLSGQCASIADPRWIQFFGARTGSIAVCGESRVFRTVDGGAHWRAMALPRSSLAFVTFSDPLDGWLLSQSGDLMSTNDTGTSWHSLPAPPPAALGKGGFPEMEFRNQWEGWMGFDGAEGPIVYSTQDGGFSWQPHALPVSVTPPAQGKVFSTSTQVALVPGSGVVASTNDGFGNVMVYSSSDGGASWRLLSPPPGSAMFSDYLFVDSTRWWAMHTAVLYKSLDAGRTWQQASITLDDYVYQPGIIDAQHAWSVIATTNLDGPGTGLAMTADGGLHWTYVKVPEPKLS